MDNPIKLDDLGIPLFLEHPSGQIIATENTSFGTPNGVLVKGNPRLFQGNLGWCFFF